MPNVIYSCVYLDQPATTEKWFRNLESESQCVSPVAETDIYLAKTLI